MRRCRFTVLGVLCASMILTGCSARFGPPPAEPENYQPVSMETLAVQSAIHDQQRLAVTGIVFLKRGTLVCANSDVDFRERRPEGCVFLTWKEQTEWMASLPIDGRSATLYGRYFHADKCRDPQLMCFGDGDPPYPHLSVDTITPVE